MNTKRAVIYHRADWDGIFSNYIARYWLKVLHPEDDVDSFGWDYGNALPDGFNHQDYPQIFVIDIEMVALFGDLDVKADIVWIDHHRSAIEKWSKPGARIMRGFRMDGVAACRLAWQWFMAQRNKTELPEKPEFISRKVKEPDLIRMAGEYDVFDLRDARVITLQYGLSSIPESDLELLIHQQFKGSLPTDAPRGNYLEMALTAGAYSRRYQEKTDAVAVKHFSGTITFRGHKFLVMNGVRSSHAFNAAIQPEHEALMAWRHDAKMGKCTVSMYAIGDPTKAPPILEIAQSMGGGGHSGACGFSVTPQTMVDILEGLHEDTLTR